MTVFSIGVALGVVLGVIATIGVALALAYRAGHPFGEIPREEPPP